MKSIHAVDSPFPMQTKIGNILDEYCTCGHLRSKHYDTVAFGHGRCAQPLCECQKFSWNCFLTKEGVQR